MKDVELAKLLAGRGQVRLSKVAEELNKPLNELARAAYSLASKGFAKIEKITSTVYELTERGKKALKEGAPEKLLAKKAPVAVNALTPEEKKVLGFAIRKGLVTVKDGKVLPLKIPEKLEIEKWLSAPEKAPREILEELLKRKFVEKREVVDFLVEVFKAPEEEIAELTPELLITGGWKGRKLRAYSVKEKPPEFFGARRHPISAVISKIRKIFLSLGFKEVYGPLVEMAFWNFDALFVPQDHPAREMQDTFYLPLKAEKLPEVAARVAEVHRKWWGNFNMELSKQMLLRTHTTSVSARKLVELEPPVRIFSVDKVFRNETLDARHLAEFHQVEGIVYAEDVTFRHLLGFLKEFFTRLGFPKVRFRPAYFPYTEPSVEIDIWFKPRNTWLELGGAGIFREEVVKPLTGTDYPVLAWGLGLERLVMLLTGLKDVRSLYRSSISWLRNREVLL